MTKAVGVNINSKDPGAVGLETNLYNRVTASPTTYGGDRDVQRLSGCHDGKPCGGNYP